jgi:hypothetical protein
MIACEDRLTKTINFTSYLSENLSLTPTHLVEKYLGFVPTVICGVLIARGCDDNDFLERVAGVSVAVIEARIGKILADPDDSLWYFSTVDHWSAKG